MIKEAKKSRFSPECRLFLLFFLTAFLLTLFSSSLCLAAKSRDLNAERNDLQDRLNKVRQQKNKVMREEKNIGQQVRVIDQELGRTSRELDQKIRDLKRAQAQEAYYKKKLVEASNKFDAYRTKYKGRLVAYYKNSHAGYIEVLFNSASFSDFVSRIAYLRMITKNDLGILTELKAIRQEVTQRKKQVEDARQNIEMDRTILAQKKEHIAQVYDVKRDALSEVQKNRRLLEEQERELEQANREVEAEIRRMMANGQGVKTKFTGTLGSPVCGRPLQISSGFGRRRSPTRGASSNHHGIDIRASYGQEICAAADGIVLRAGYLNGYGNAVIISHGSDIATLYGHGLRVLVGSGAHVKKGQVIMLADSTGISTGNHLHFEVRVNGVAVNPIR
jgi:murein DD-endopeptidase MepM/ murein hydrolase activator NlpD